MEHESLLSKKTLQPLVLLLSLVEEASSGLKMAVVEAHVLALQRRLFAALQLQRHLEPHGSSTLSCSNRKGPSSSMKNSAQPQGPAMLEKQQTLLSESIDRIGADGTHGPLSPLPCSLRISHTLDAPLALTCYCTWRSILGNAVCPRYPRYPNPMDPQPSEKVVSLQGPSTF